MALKALMDLSGMEIDWLVELAEDLPHYALLKGIN